MATEEETGVALDRATAILSEVFETATIVGTVRIDNTDTHMSRSRGFGNFYAQLGAVAEWLIFQRARSKAEGAAMADEEREAEDDG